jgi:hypothetical protein
MDPLRHGRVNLQGTSGACRIGPFRVARMCNFCFRTPKKPIRRGNAASIARCTFQGCREILRMSEHSWENLLITRDGHPCPQKTQKLVFALKLKSNGHRCPLKFPKKQKASCNGHPCPLKHNRYRAGIPRRQIKAPSTIRDEAVCCRHEESCSAEPRNPAVPEWSLNKRTSHGPSADGLPYRVCQQP